jgi:hypothetical protein
LLLKLHHPKNCGYGVVPGGTLGTVTGYMVNGSLKQVLHRKDRTIDHREWVIIATDAAFGMDIYITKKVVHFDLKCENLLAILNVLYTRLEILACLKSNIRL